MDRFSNFAFPIICKTKEKRISLVEKAKDTVEIRPIVGGDMTEQPFFKKYVQDSHGYHLPNAAIIHNQGFYFGNNPELTKKELAFLAQLFA
jgi:CDP-6-deoxy-D-xylo-4-hexulose-3-dehydrase